MQLNSKDILTAAQGYRDDMVRFLRDIVRLPGESCEERATIERIVAEMKSCGFDEVKVDGMGNALGFIGEGERIVAFDAHIDTVGIGNKDNWEFDPYEGFEDEFRVGGRGTSDQLGGIVSAVYGARIAKEKGLIPSDCKLLVTATVQEEDCDGLCWQYIINELGIRPEFVVITEPTDGGIYRGQRGRMEIFVTAKGVSCHGSAPERGDNAIYKMADIIADVRALNDNDESGDIKGLSRMLLPQYNDEYAEAAFLGRGTVTVSQVFYTSPSRCAVADGCTISLDRRMTAGETYESCLEEIRNLPSVSRYGEDITVGMYDYERPSYTGLIYPTKCYFPTWVTGKEHFATKTLESVHRELFGEERTACEFTREVRAARPLTDKWTFSTNGVSIMGREGIPCIGFGPGAEAQAHAPNEITYISDLVNCAALYAAVAECVIFGVI